MWFYQTKEKKLLLVRGQLNLNSPFLLTAQVREEEL